ncbi:MAG TPA: FG-GAP-like repeat-containing protein [Pirellulaceae bacterium]|nr:FG-GAP-like repeat-containing protein [Pirellulaceae bacterium]
MTQDTPHQMASSPVRVRIKTTDERVSYLVILLALLGATVSLHPIWVPNANERLLHEAALLLASEQYADAERCANDLLQRDSQSSQALLIAGEAAIRQVRNEHAIRYFQRVEDDGSEAAVHALYRTGERLMATGHAREAEQYLRRALHHDSGHTKANKKLAVLLQVQGRTWESAPFVRRILLDGGVAKDHLLMVGAIDTTFVEDYQFVENCLESDAGNSQVLLGRARQLLAKSRLKDAEPLLQRIVDEQPESIEAQARLGGIFLDRGADAEFLEWQRNLPAGAGSHPEIWHVQGLWARRNGQLRAAARCFLEAARLDPNHKGAVFQLSQLLNETQHSNIAKQLSVRSQRLAQLHYLLMEVRFGYNAQLARKMVDLLDLLDRPLEAIGWCYVLQQWKLGNEVWAKPRALQLLDKLPSGDTLTLSSGNLVARLDPNDFPLPHWPEVARKGEELKSTSPLDGNIRFVDVAADVGIEFEYFNGTTAETGLSHILQATGGGIAVIDYDQDGSPDLYFVQSGPFPIQAGQTKYTNRLYRNLGNGRFENVTDSTGLGDAGYGQGVAVGDYNNDGFPDLYVANFGGNRLYENTGSGDFVDVTIQAGVSGDHWTTSCMMADLDGDTWPEIYAVNYALKDEVLELNCKHEDQPRTCAPTLLTADQDQLYRNRGDGSFENVTQQSGVVAPDGKGLGVVAADFEHRGQLDIFVANDTSANFFFHNETGGPRAKLLFKEEAIVNGVGFDEVGNLQACMGLAAGDANGDGLLDLFVTNFYGESNVLYLQDEDHRFTDSTRQANLREPSFHMLGFGAQFIDGELDGWPDLIITNGHIDLTFAHGNPDRMPPQYLRNAGGGQFEELTSESLGPYFQSRYFGRALAKLDWNRDGREDVCISHLDAPTALLTNTTPTTGNYLAVKLCGVTSNRDAIGAIVTVEAGERKWVQHVIGGGGYFVSNQRQILFGLANSESVDRLTINWPSGNVQTFKKLPVDQEVVIVEGRSLLRLSESLPE